MKKKRKIVLYCKLMFSGVDTGKLGDLVQGKYIVKAAKKENSWFGKTYRLLIHKINKQDIIVWSNANITKKLEEAENAKTMDLTDNFLYLQHDNLGVLEITGYGYTPNRHKMVYCNITLNTRKSEEKPKQMLPKMRMNRCVLDIRDLEVRGQKRKLILTDNGDGPVIYKFKKSKLEENVEVGDML